MHVQTEGPAVTLKYADIHTLPEATLYILIPYICTQRVKGHMLGTYAYVQRQADILITYIYTHRQMTYAQYICVHTESS